MVLTEEELMLAISSEDRRIQSNLLARWSTDSLGTQCCCDREIQRYLLRKGTAAYKFNCFIIHQPARFIKVCCTIATLFIHFSHLAMKLLLDGCSA